MSAGAGSGAPRTLWRDEAGGRFYLVPDASDMGTGALLLRSGATRVVHADPAAVAPYEVSREEGRAFLDAKLDAFVGGTKARAESWLDRVAPRSQQDGEAAPAGAANSGSASAAGGSAQDGPSAAADGPPLEHGPGVKLFASLTGETEETVAGSPEALLRGLGRLFEGAAQAVAQARTGEEGREAAMARLRALGEQLRAHGISAPPAAPGKGRSSDSA